MKKSILRNTGRKLFFLVTIFSCLACEPDSTPEPEVLPETAIQLDNFNKISIYKNKTGSSTADALQAQLINSKENYTLNFYGTFNSLNNPEKVTTVTYKKQNDGTTVNFLFNPTNQKLETIFFEKNGIQQPLVIKHEYPGGENTVKVSFFNYDWSKDEASLVYQGIYENENGSLKESPVYGLKSKIDSGTNTFATTAAAMGAYSFGDVAFSVGAGVVIVEAALYGFVGSGVALPYLASLAAIPGVGQALLVAAGGTAALIAAIDLLSRADASELTPEDQPYPENTPVENPSNEHNPTPNLDTPNCGNISFKPSMDSEGTIMITEIQGGSGPYQYSINGAAFGAGNVFSDNHATLFPNDYEEGEFSIVVKDANGCNSVSETYLQRELDIASLLINGSPWKLISYSIYGIDFFQYQDRGNEACYPTGVFDKERVIEGDVRFSTGSASIGTLWDTQTYDCEVQSYIGSNYYQSYSHSWRIDENTGKYMMTWGEATGELNVSVSGNRVTLSGPFNDPGFEESTTFSMVLEQ